MKNIKAKALVSFFVFVIAVGLIVSGPARIASAASLTSSQISAIISLLQSFGADQSVINNVQASLTGTPVSASAVNFCYNFGQNLRIGDYNSDVTNLVLALNKEGLLSGKTDTFDEQVASAVTAFQEKYASEILTPNGLGNGTGYVGPSTRVKLNALYGCGKGTPPAVFCAQDMYTCPNGISVSRIAPSCNFAPCIPTSQPFISSVAGMAASNGEIDAGGKVGIVGTNLAGNKDATNVYIGGKTCTITQLGNNLIYCTAPSDLVVGNTYDLYINTVGPGGDKVTSNIVKVKVLSNVSQSSVTVYFSLQNTFNDRAGGWGVFAAGAGNFNKNPADWNWLATINFPTVGKQIKRMTIMHNIHGEVWSTGYSRYLADGTDLYGYDEHPYPLVVSWNGIQITSQYDDQNMILRTMPTGTQTFYLYGQPESTPFTGGKLVVEFTDGTSASAIIPASSFLPPALLPTITVLSPNGEETYKVGDTIKIRWSVTGSISSTERVFLLVDKENGSRFNFGSTYAVNGWYDWVIPANYNGKYKILISEDADGNDVGDILAGSSSFTIVAPLTDTDILKRLVTVVTNNQTGVDIPTPTPRLDFDFNGDGFVDTTDILKLFNISRLSDSEFISVRDKMLTAIKNRAGQSSGSNLFDPNLDLNSDGIISVPDFGIARNAMNNIHPLSAVSITVSNSSSVPAQNIYAGVPNQTLGGFDITVTGEPVSVSKIALASIGISGTPCSHTDITNVSLYHQSGNIVAGPIDFSGTTSNCSSGFCFTDTVTFPVGTNTYVLKGKLGTKFSVDQSLRVLMNPGQYWSGAVGQTSGAAVSLPNTTFALNTVTVKAVELSDAEIISRIIATINSNQASALTPSTSPKWDFDLNADNSVDSGDILRVRNLAALSNENFQITRDKILTAIQKRIFSKVGDALYDSNLDFDSDGTITALDQTRARNAMNAVHPIVSSSAGQTSDSSLDLAAVSAIAAFSQKKNLNLASILSAIEQFIEAFKK